MDGYLRHVCSGQAVYGILNLQPYPFPPFRGKGKVKVGRCLAKPGLGCCKKKSCKQAAQRCEAPVPLSGSARPAFLVFRRGARSVRDSIDASPCCQGMLLQTIHKGQRLELCRAFAEACRSCCAQLRSQRGQSRHSSKSLPRPHCASQAGI